MPLRITTWNVNGIRNPFGYPPWRDDRTFSAMFDILEADIVIFQELKIQPKDLRDDVVLVPGWDCYFSLPKHKKGYSGVAIYTHQSVCAPIRAEEGILGILCPPGSKTPYRDLLDDAAIGGYPSSSQIEEFGIDPAALDAEGRCVVLEFPSFVILGVYSPANSNGLRDGFRYGFLCALDARIRNLCRLGKRVILAGDLNVSREEIDTANAEETIRKEGLTPEEYFSMPNRRIFNQLVQGGKVVGPRDQNRDQPVLWDSCREFFPTRRGMYTHWEQKINARPGNFGSRIDYILCSTEMKSWIEDANIQEGLMGSDHCPVYVVLRDIVDLGGAQVHLKDIMNPPGTFARGERKKQLSAKDVPPLSGRLMPEFMKRRSIKEMFAKTATIKSTSPRKLQPTFSEQCPSGPDRQSSEDSAAEPTSQLLHDSTYPHSYSSTKAKQGAQERELTFMGKKRKIGEPKASKPLKRTKSNLTSLNSGLATKDQTSLKSFLIPRQPGASQIGSHHTSNSDCHQNLPARMDHSSVRESGYDHCLDSMREDGNTGRTIECASTSTKLSNATSQTTPPIPSTDSQINLQHSSTSYPLSESSRAGSPSTYRQSSQVSYDIIDPILSKDSWNKLFSKPSPPRCEDHKEPCVRLTTKKSGLNCGRAFWICQRPLGPTGNKESNTQWRCGTFIWASDWNANSRA